MLTVFALGVVVGLISGILTSVLGQAFVIQEMVKEKNHGSHE